MNPRQFKKLCAKSYAIVVRKRPLLPKYEFRLEEREPAGDYCSWHRNGCPKGTLGFGHTSGYYEPEWSDKSAYSTLKEIVDAEFSVLDEDADGWPCLPRGINPKGWRGWLALAESMAVMKGGL